MVGLSTVQTYLQKQQDTRDGIVNQVAEQMGMLPDH